MTPYQLFERGASTLVASWAEYARGTSGASVRRVPGATVAVFADEPERVVYNNTLMDLGLDAAGREAAVSAMEEAYAGEGIEHFAAWVHENDAPLRTELEGRGYGVTESTRAMGIALEDLDLPRPDLDLLPADWHDYVAMIGLGPDFQRYADPAAYVIRVARLDGEAAAVAMAYDHDGDRGIYSVTTREHARRRGLGTALTTLLLHEARDAGCTTATLQSTPMAERIYASVGFRDLGRFLEHARGGPSLP